MDIMQEPEFFLMLPEITGAVAAVREMSTLPGLVMGKTLTVFYIYIVVSLKGEILLKYY